MGSSCCSSGGGGDLTLEGPATRKLERAKSEQLEQQMNIDHFADHQIHKLLLLGAGESGKSTLFKQMVTIYGRGYPESERATFTSIIYNNIITSMKTLCEHADLYSNGRFQPENQQYKQLIENELKGDEEIDHKLGKALLALWHDKGIQSTYEQRSHFQLTDSSEYFFNRLEHVQQENYIPSEQDILRARVKTTGILEHEFEIDGNQFKMIDVGGPPNERKKWMHCFKNVTAVLFVVAISEYDQVLYEDENTNRMVESLNLFEEICNSRWFKETAMILFLNKRDLFAEKCKKVSVTVCFPDYTGDDSYDVGVKFLQEQFESKNRNTDKRVYTHVTCATDTDNICAVFNAVKDILIRKALIETGLV